MENDDCFIQVPDENSLERMEKSKRREGERRGGEKLERERKEAKSMVHSVGLQGDPPGQ